MRDFLINIILGYAAIYIAFSVVGTIIAGYIFYRIFRKNK